MEVNERKIATICLIGAIALQVIAMCVRNWMEGYYGDVLVVTLCPWRLCYLNCFKCSSEKPTIECLWVKDWNETGFETFAIVAHLEYWYVGTLALALLLSILDWAQSCVQRVSRCSLKINKASLLVLLVTSLISTVSVSLFGAKLRHPTSEISTFEGVQLQLAWPYFVRLFSGLAAWSACVAAICSQCTSTTRNLISNNATIMVTTIDKDFDEDSLDETENGVLL